jgi:tRNA threonylcarbamoyladenosine biosynthesis protein TsaB
VNILAIDTATEILSAALKTEKGQWYLEIDAGLRHSELLMEMCDTITKMADISQKDLHLIACMQGPGSFTGLRIGFSAAKGISTALNIPFISIPTLDCMAHPHQFWQGYVLPVIDAKKQCFFTALYHQNEILHDYADIPIEEILSFLPNDKPVFVCGPAAELFCKRVGELPITQNVVQNTQKVSGYAKSLLEKAEKQYIMNGMKGDSAVSGPLYLRKSDAELEAASKNRGL